MDEKVGENELLERVFLRLGSASTDEQLEEFTKKFLTPVLLKLASPSEDVRKKVLELLAQINRLLKNRECVQLPVDGLFLQYQDPQCTEFVRNFTILYLKMGFTRLNPAKQLEHLPQLFSSMAGRPQPQQMCFLQLAIPVFTLFSKDNTSAMKGLHAVISKDKTILDLFLGFVLDVLILPYGAVTNNKSDPQKSVVPPGLSCAALQQVLSSGITVDNLEGIKLGILKFLSADLFDTTTVQVHLVVATSDSHHTITDYAGHQLKRITEASDWEHVNVMSKLMAIFLGSINLPGKPATPPDECRTAASMPLQLKIFPFLLKSRKSTNIFPACLQIVFQVDQDEGRNQAKRKLKKFRIQFIHHLCEFSSDKVISIISPILLSTLLKIIADDNESDLEQITFLAIGKIAKRSPTLFHKDTTVIQSLFQAIHGKDPDTGLDILQALSMIANACKAATSQTLAMIEALVLNNVSQENPQCRLAALQIANILFPTNHVKSRYACLLASADMRNDIKEEANRGLLVRQHEETDSNDSPNFPDFCEMVNFIHQTLHDGNGYKQSYVTVAGTLLFPPAILINMLQYLHRCLSSSSGVTQEDADNDQSLIPISKYVQKILNNQRTVVYQYLSFIQEALKPAGSYGLHSVALVNLLEMLASATIQLAPELNRDGLSWIRSFIWSSHNVIRNTSAQIFAILICQSGKDMVLQELTSLLTTVNDPSEAVQNGTIICIGHLIGQYLSQQNLDTSQQMEVEDLDDSETFEPKIEKAISETFMAIIRFLASQSSLLVHTACDAIGEVCNQSSMPLPDGVVSPNDGNSDEKALLADKILSKADIIQQLAYIMNNSKEQKLCEKAALVLGMTCVGEQQFPHTKEAIAILFDASKKRDIDFQFTVGEALSCAGAGKLSTASRSKWVAGDSLVNEIPETKETMRWMLEKIVREYIISDVAHVRKAACIWLLVLLKHSSKHSAVQEMMAEIQQAFSAMLSESDEIVQEVSSKGLSLIYEFGSEEFRKDIVASLVDTMLSGKKKVQNVTGDTKLFDKAMPLGDAGQLSTYKELCSLANDMNQPELVYRFLHLANHNALWNSKKGAAFGFASIASQARKELEPHLKTLVPKLYRYLAYFQFCVRFPFPNIIVLFCGKHHDVY
jgi:proteasome component ECM29